MFKSEGHGEKTMIDRAEFEKWAKENGKIIIDPQDKFMNTMKIIELMKEKNITVYKLSKMTNYDRTNLKKILVLYKIQSKIIKKTAIYTKVYSDFYI